MATKRLARIRRRRQDENRLIVLFGPISARGLAFELDVQRNEYGVEYIDDHGCGYTLGHFLLGGVAIFGACVYVIPAYLQGTFGRIGFDYGLLIFMGVGLLLVARGVDLCLRRKVVYMNATPDRITVEDRSIWWRRRYDVPLGDCDIVLHKVLEWSSPGMECYVAILHWGRDCMTLAAYPDNDGKRKAVELARRLGFYHVIQGADIYAPGAKLTF